MIKRVAFLRNRASGILHRYGLIALFKGVLLYLIANGLVRQAILVGVNDFRNLPEINIELKGLEFKRISNPFEVDALITRGFNFDNFNTFYRDIHNLKETLSKGAVLYAAFVDKQFASMIWVVYNEKARQDIDNLPYKVDFEHGETYHGGSETFPKYRNMGIHSCNLSRMYKNLKLEGITLDKHAQMGNGETTSRIERYGGKVIGRGTLIKIGLWSFWKEKDATN